MIVRHFSNKNVPVMISQLNSSKLTMRHPIGVESDESDAVKQMRNVMIQINWYQSSLEYENIENILKLENVKATRRVLIDDIAAGHVHALSSCWDLRSWREWRKNCAAMAWDFFLSIAHWKLLMIKIEVE